MNVSWFRCRKSPYVKQTVCFVYEIQSLIYSLPLLEPELIQSVIGREHYVHSKRAFVALDGESCFSGACIKPVRNTCSCSYRA